MLQQHWVFSCSGRILHLQCKYNIGGLKGEVLLVFEVEGWFGCLLVVVEAGWLVGEKGGLGGNYCTDHCMHAFTDHYCTDYCTTAPTGLLN